MATGVFGGQCVEKHSVYIFDRGGMNRIGQVLDLSSVQWVRDRDGVTEATIRVEGDACREQARFISELRSHRHEMIVYRGRDRVWEGPIHRIASYPHHTEIVAHDVTEYLFHTPMTQYWDNRNTRVTTVTGRIGEIIEYELTHGRVQNGVSLPAWEAMEPPINVVPFLSVHHFPNEARTAAYTVPFEMTVGDHLQNLARQSGIDYAAVGRAIHIWDVSRPMGRIQQLTESDFLSEIVVTEYGADHTQISVVVGQEGRYGSAVNQANLEYYGPWTDITTQYNEEGSAEPTQAELDSQASRNLSGLSPVPTEVRIPDNSGLILSETLTINDLVPGVNVPLRAVLNARQMNQMQKIDRVVVTETAAGESVQLTLTPTTRQDSDEEEEEEG